MENDELTRRDFVTTVAAGIVAAAGGDLAAQQQVTETNVEIKTPDGTCDAAFIHPASGAHPAVIIWPDAFGLRPSMRDMAKRLAAEGYSVLVPNPFYRVAKSPIWRRRLEVQLPDRAPQARAADGIDPGRRRRREGCTRVHRVARHAEAGRSQQKDRHAGLLHGRRARRAGPPPRCPNRVGAGASFHGGGLVTQNPNSPHLLAPKIKARMYFGIATNDDMQQPDAKTKLKEAFDAAKVPAEVEVYSMAQHGWCVPDMPAQPNGQPIYNKDDAERAWSKLLALYKAGLV